jgi:demethylmenaquinone methyltransferase/2-methoxy-6-polyprenyl-1,4-benzoquinol methylase
VDIFDSGRRASLHKDPGDVADMFSLVAPRYDLMNDLASLGQDRRWRAAVVDALAPQPGELILDLAAGTGTSSAPIARGGATVIATDLTPAMVLVGAQRYPTQIFVVADGARLPFKDQVFDAATISFGLRNVADPHQVAAELWRVVRPGGTLVVCEFSTPTAPWLRWVYRFWRSQAIPALSRLASANPSAYQYLDDSIAAWPDQRGLADLLHTAGWRHIQWRDLSGGIVALHRATRP